MSRYVPDILTKRWVIIAAGRLKRPEDVHQTATKKICPFCPGNEVLTTNEVFRIGKNNSDQSGWQVRVIPNKYPITDFHEVIVHSPHHNQDIEHLSAKEVTSILVAYRERFNFYRNRGQVLIFCNHGEHSGASITHPHSQLVVIPEQINLDTLTREPMNNIVEENKFFTSYCPEFSQWPYEVWLAPKEKDQRFGDLKDDQLIDFAILLKKTLAQLEQVYKTKKMGGDSFGYNFYIYPHSNWYLRIIPRFVHRAGFELGTGLSVNIVDPYNASLDLKGIGEEMAGVLKKLKKF